MQGRPKRETDLYSALLRDRMKKRKRRRWVGSLLLALSLLVTSLVFWQLRHVGITMTDDQFFSGQAVDPPFEGCRDSILVCDQLESDGHDHDDICNEFVLNCEQAEEEEGPAASSPQQVSQEKDLGPADNSGQENPDFSSLLHELDNESSDLFSPYPQDLSLLDKPEGEAVEDTNEMMEEKADPGPGTKSPGSPNTFVLPATGGGGQSLYTISGLLLMAVTLMYQYKRKKCDTKDKS